jgi:hypothetical protein
MLEAMDLASREVLVALHFLLCKLPPFYSILPQWQIEKPHIWSAMTVPLSVCLSGHLHNSV